MSNFSLKAAYATESVLNPLFSSEETLTTIPFTDNSRYFSTPELSQRHSLIRHLLQNSEQLLLILAKNGAGKTALFKQLHANTATHWRILSLTGHPALSPESCLLQLLSMFNVRLEGKSLEAMQLSLRAHIASDRNTGNLPILLVDDAHLIPLTTLQWLVQLTTQGEAFSRLRLVLFAEPQMTSMLATPELSVLHNTLIHTLDIPAFSIAQTREYLQFQLQNSRYLHDHPFSHEVLKQLYQQTEGNPAALNYQANYLLQKRKNYSFAPQLISDLSQLRLLWGIILLVLLLAVGGWIRWQYPELFNEQIPNDFPSSSLASRDFTETLVTPANALPSATLTAAPALDNPPIPLSAEQLKQESWLLTQPSTAYTLQLLGAHDVATLNSFLQKYTSTEQLALFKTHYHGQAWYILLQGIYPDRQHALQAVEQLPASLRATIQPWPRSLASVQARLRYANQDALN